MSLVIPPEIKRDINKYSGYIDPSSKFSQKNLKGLFYTDENINYLCKELYQLITFEPYVRENLPDDSAEDIPNLLGTHENAVTGFNNKSSYLSKSGRIVNTFRGQQETLNRVIFGMIEAHQMPFDEDLGIKNPVQQLHGTNLDFLVKTSRDLIQSPGNLVYQYNAINPDTGRYEGNVEYDFNAESYSDGTWHPEHLFTNSQRNRENPYWLPIEVNIYSEPDATGVGHRYNNIVYNKGTKEYYQSGINYDGSRKVGTKTANSYGPFPGWQTTVNKRFYDKEVTGGLRDGGLNDRRVQMPHGYNMQSLRKKPSY